MKAITRLILRHVVSGHVKLTPRVLQVLKELDQDQAGAGTPQNPGDASDVSPEQVNCEAPGREKRLVFVNPLPGRWMRRTECGVGVALLLAITLVQAASAPDTFNTANNAFARGKYTEAAQGYESVIAQQGYSAPLLFNLANAQLRAGQFGQSIFNYERAALLNPNDPGIEANLNAARQKAGIAPEQSSRLQTVARLLTMSAWSGLAAVALFLLAATWPLKLLRPQAGRLFNFGGALAALTLAISIGALVVSRADLRRAVVTAPGAVAGVSPVTMAEPVLKLRAGEAVTVQQTHGAFALIQNGGGHEGWVKAGDITRLIPTPGISSRS